MEFMTRIELRRKLIAAWVAEGSQAKLARKIGVKPQNLSAMINGSPINGKVLVWLGYEAVNDLYRPLNGKRRKAT
jgi:plasmid maintenance system antidote protein VapI